MAKAENPEEEINRIDGKDEAQIYDWLRGFGNRTIKVALKRTYPMTYKGVQVKGTIGHYDQAISEEDVAQEHGGGRFQIIVHYPRRNNKTGSMGMAYGGSRTFEIAGPPKIDSLLRSEEDEEDEDDGSNGENAGPVDRVMKMAEGVLRERSEEVQELRRQSAGSGLRDLEVLVSPLRDQVESLRKALGERDKQVFDLMQREPDRSSENRLFDVLANKEDTHGNAIKAIRTEHDSEMRQLRDFHREELRRREDRFEREMESQKTAHQRELDAIERSHTQALESQRHGYDMRIDSLKDIQKRLDRELTEARTEIAALRAKKEMSPVEQMQGLKALKDGWDMLLPTGGEEPSKGTVERILEGAMNSPIAEALASRFAGPSPEQLAAMQQGGAQEQMIAVRGPDGQVRQVPASMIARMQAARAQAQEEESTVPPPPEIDQADVERAVKFIEAAYGNGTDPAVLARSASAMLPDDLLEHLRQVGVDHFLNNVAKIQTGPLASVTGRMYVRKVAAFLIDGSSGQPSNPDADEVPEDEDESPEVETSSPVEG